MTKIIVIYHGCLASKVQYIHTVLTVLTTHYKLFVEESNWIFRHELLHICNFMVTMADFMLHLACRMYIAASIIGVHTHGFCVSSTDASEFMFALIVVA